MNRRAVLFLAGYIITAIVLYLLNPSAGTEGEDYRRLYSGYDIVYRGEVYHNRYTDDIDDVTGGSLLRGDEIELSHLLTETGDLLFPAVYFTTRDCAVSVGLDGVICYEYGTDALSEGAYIGEAAHIVDLDMDAEGRLLTIRLVAASDGAHIRLSAPLFGEHEKVMRAVGNPLTAAYDTGAFLVLYGLSSLLAIMIFYFRLRRFETQVLASMLSAVCGLWLIGLVKMQTYTLPVLFLTLPLLYGYLLLLPKKMPKRMPKKVLYILAASGSALSFVFFLLQVTGTVHGVILCIPYIVLLLIALVTPVMVSIEDITEHRVFSPSSMQLLGVLCICLFLLTGAVFQTVDYYSGTGRVLFLHYILPGLSALYLTAQMYRYTAIIYESRSTHSENEVLYRVAYEDPLTALYNRAGWDEKMKQLGSSKEPYCVISMDLDGLKAINDTQGHQAGDKLIKGFAKALTESFPERFFLSRIGGDEFCVIMEDAPESEVRRCLNRLEGRLIALDKKEKHINHRCSYGYAIKESDEQTAHELYLTADERMYAMKQTHKAAKKADAMTRADSNEVKVAQMVEETLKQMGGAESVPLDAEKKSSTEALLAAAEAAAKEEEKKAVRPAPVKTAAQAHAALRRPLMTEQKRREQALQSIKQQEIERVSKENAMKKAMKALEQAQQNDKGG